jgi:DHA1 family bicyclomycin/chloramphenicol resistance-like MFS transporter
VCWADSVSTKSITTARAGATGLTPGLLVILGCLSAFGPLSTDMYLPGLPSLARDLGVSAATAGLTLSGCLVGIAIGQLVCGPLSDALGRRRPLLAGLAAYVLASALCAASPSIVPLVILRFIQGLAGASGIAVARAVVRDRSAGVAAARAYATLMIVTALGPIFAPIVGGLLLHVTDWRGIFGVLASIGALLLVGAALRVRETLARDARQTGGQRAMRDAIAALLSDRVYVSHVLAGSLAFATLMAYIAASPFVIERIHHLSPQSYSIVFAVNGSGILIGRQIAARLLARAAPAEIMRGAQICQAMAALGVLALTLTRPALVPLLCCLFVVVASVGAIMPMATALAMNDHPERAGSASGLLGFTQFTLGSVVAPLVGVAGAGSALPMAVTMPVCAVTGLAVSVRSLRRG